MSYPSRYYDMQRTVIAELQYAQRTGLCPVCRRRPRGIWPSGRRRITCGADQCFRRWLPGRSDSVEVKSND